MGEVFCPSHSMLFRQNDFIRKSEPGQEHDMNTLIVKVMPQGDFADVSVLTNGWQTKFQVLVSQKRSIKYDFYPLPKMPQEIRTNLDQQGYSDFVLENDRWQHFFVPNLD